MFSQRAPATRHPQPPLDCPTPHPPVCLGGADACYLVVLAATLFFATSLFLMLLGLIWSCTRGWAALVLLVPPIHPPTPAPAYCRRAHAVMHTGVDGAL